MDKNWKNQLNEVTQQFTTTFGQLSAQELNWKKNTDQWSIAQIIDHIITINETYYPIFAALKAGNYSTPKVYSWNPISNFVGKKVLQALEPSRKKKISTFEIWEPSTSNINADILEKFTVHQSTLAEHYDEMVSFMEAGTKISSPANKKFVYRLDVGFEAILLHEKRHYNQALEVLNQMKSNQN